MLPKLVLIQVFMTQVARRSNSVVWYQYDTTPQKCCLKDTTTFHTEINMKIKDDTKNENLKSNFLTKF